MSVADPLATPSRIAFVGDVHGDADFAARALAYARRERGADVVLQAGDLGFRYQGQEFLTALSDAACMLELPVLWADGNHENHDALDALPLDPATGLRSIAPGVWHLPRGLRWSWAGVRFLALGGAPSVDRHLRTPGFDWFPQESLSRDDVLRAANGGAADVMLCHDAPGGIAIPHLRPGVFPSAAIRTAEEHRRILRLVVDVVRPRWLIHGHYHVPYVAELVGDGYRCVVRGLADNRAATLSHAVFVQPLRCLAQRTEAASAPVTVQSAGSGRRTRRS